MLWHNLRNLGLFEHIGLFWNVLRRLRNSWDILGHFEVFWDVLG